MNSEKDETADLGPPPVLGCTKFDTDGVKALNTAQEVLESNAAQYSRPKINHNDPAYGDALKKEKKIQKQHRQHKEYHTRDGILYPIARPKFRVMAVGALAFAVCMFVILNQMNLPLWICILCVSCLFIVVLLSWLVITVMLRYPHITEFLMFKTGLFDDLRESHQYTYADDGAVDDADGDIETQSKSPIINKNNIDEI